MRVKYWLTIASIFLMANLANLANLVFDVSRSSAQQRLDVKTSTIVDGDSKWDWTQARTAFAKTESPFSFTTMSRTTKLGSHGYHDIYFTLSRNDGRSWSKPKVIPPLRRTEQDDGYEVVAGDLWPTWHRATQKILLTGKTFNFAEGSKENILREQVSYAVIDPSNLNSGPLRTVVMPKKDHVGEPIIAPNAGCHQRVDLPNGEILLPVRYQRSESKRIYVTVVARCRFDGTTLEYVEHGTEHFVNKGRGLYEPSLARLGHEYFLTMRADDGAYVSKSSDGINFSKQRPWTFDDGEPLGSYNTQQHWVRLGSKLYLVYTRRGADNDHIMRHRAPLFIARVDTESLQVIRSTEQVLVAENHATLGNSGVCQISEDEAWVTVAEGRVSYGARKGENNSVILVKITAADH